MRLLVRKERDAIEKENERVSSERPHMRRAFIQVATEASATAVSTALKAAHSEVSPKLSHAINMDLLACGGGCAGIAAALSADRDGATTLLIEWGGSLERAHRGRTLAHPDLFRISFSIRHNGMVPLIPRGRKIRVRMPSAQTTSSPPTTAFRRRQT